MVFILFIFLLLKNKYPNKLYKKLYNHFFLIRSIKENNSGCIVLSYGHQYAYNKSRQNQFDEDDMKKSLIKESASPEIISQYLAKLKANKVSLVTKNQIVLLFRLVLTKKGLSQ